jgi:hypothetical protein
MSKGLHKMYLACKQNSCFPGPLPEASDTDGENVSIHAILQCLGLIENPHDLQLEFSSRTNLQGDGVKKKDNREDEPSTTQDMSSSAPLLSSTSTTNSLFSALPQDNFSDGLFPIYTLEQYRDVDPQAMLSSFDSEILQTQHARRTHGVRGLPSIASTTSWYDGTTSMIMRS